MNCNLRVGRSRDTTQFLFSMPKQRSPRRLRSRTRTRIASNLRRSDAALDEPRSPHLPLAHAPPKRDEPAPPKEASPLQLSGTSDAGAALDEARARPRCRGLPLAAGASRRHVGGPRRGADAVLRQDAPVGPRLSVAQEQAPRHLRPLVTVTSVAQEQASLSALAGFTSRPREDKAQPEDEPPPVVDATPAARGWPGPLVDLTGDSPPTQLDDTLAAASGEIIDLEQSRARSLEVPALEPGPAASKVTLCLRDHRRARQGAGKNQD